MTAAIHTPPRARPVTDALVLRGVVKRFGTTLALDGIDLQLRRGTLHSLLEENGAGKSTLMHIVYGMIRPDSGSIEIGGVPYIARDPRTARRLGVGKLHQHFTSIPAHPVWQTLELAAR